jgi:hypothetical protein
MIVNDIADVLSMSFSLMVPAHDSKDTQETFVIIHGSWAQRVERKLARPVAVRVRLVQREEGPSILELDAPPGNN